MTHAYKCRIITGSDDSKVKVVAVETGNVMYTMAFHRSWVRAVLSTQDHFISCSDDR
jgi:WD40 repeat protein